jgi:uncharacterized protein YbjT (DUF2867 family)
MSNEALSRTILLLGASGLIGRSVIDELRRGGLNAIGVARHYLPSQKTDMRDLEMPLISMTVASLTTLLIKRKADILVNCLGVLQDGPGSDTQAVHRDFVSRLLQAIHDSGHQIHFVHISIPGNAERDQTAFSKTKRDAERLIADSGIAHTILRPGFVIAPSAYGGSALIRALAALPIDLPPAVEATPFQTVAVEDVAATIAWLTRQDTSKNAAGRRAWDLMHPQPVTLGEVIDQFRHPFGTANAHRIPVPSFMLDIGAKLGDLVNRLGWAPPMRSTAIAELRRGVAGDPAPWIAATGIQPKSLQQTVGRHAATIQDKWFARLFLVKSLMLGSLVAFWIASGFIALGISYDAAAAILTSHGFPSKLVAPITIGTSLMDMSIGVLIAFRRTCAVGLIIGIIASLGYMLGSALLTPDLWIEPLGALVKTGPAIVLMLIAMLTLDNR